MDYKIQLELRNQMSQWLNKSPWQIWFTGTFTPEQFYRDTIKTKGAFNKFIEKLSVDFDKQEIEYFLAIERFAFGDECHCHALIRGLEGLTYRQIGETWRDLYGREKVEGYDPTRGANYYLTKYITKELCDWDLKIKNRKS